MSDKNWKIRNKELKALYSGFLFWCLPMESFFYGLAGSFVLCTYILKSLYYIHSFQSSIFYFLFFSVVYPVSVSDSVYRCVWTWECFNFVTLFFNGFSLVVLCTSVIKFHARTNVILMTGLDGNSFHLFKEMSHNFFFN